MRSEKVSVSGLMPPKTVLVDGSNALHRAFHASLLIGKQKSDVDKRAVFLFSNMVLKILRDFEFDHLGIFFDKGRSFRADMYPEYKAMRKRTPDSLRVQWPICLEFLDAFRVPRLDDSRYEADDLIATYCKKAKQAGHESVTIVTSDKDLMQLVNDEYGVCLYHLHSKKLLRERDVEAIWGIQPSLIPHIQALTGDKIDNIPGIPGIGPKRAAALIQTYGSVDAVFGSADTVKPDRVQRLLSGHRENAQLSYELALLVDDCEDTGDIQALKYSVGQEPIDLDGLVALCNTHELPSLVPLARKQLLL